MRDKLEATQLYIYNLLKDFSDGNIGHSVADYHLFYGSKYG